MREMLQALACLEECTDCDEANVEEWLQIDAFDPDYAILSDEKIVQTVTNPETVDTDDSDLDELHDVEPIPSHAKACEMLKECIRMWVMSTNVYISVNPAGSAHSLTFPWRRM